MPRTAFSMGLLIANYRFHSMRRNEGGLAVWAGLKTTIIDGIKIGMEFIFYALAIITLTIDLGKRLGPEFQKEPHGT